MEHGLLNKKIQLTIFKKKELTRYKTVADKDIKLVCVKQGSGSGSDPDSIRSMDPNPGGQKGPTKVEKINKFHIFKC